MAVVHNLLPRIIKSGLGVLSPVAGIHALSKVLQQADFGPQLVVSPFDWSKLMAGAQGNVFPLFQEFADFATPKPGSQAPQVPQNMGRSPHQQVSLRYSAKRSSKQLPCNAEIVNCIVAYILLPEFSALKKVCSICRHNVVELLSDTPILINERYELIKCP